MLAAGIPAKFPLTFAQNASGGFIRTIPTASQIGLVPGAASLNDGFPPLTFTPVTSGGIPPDGRDMNGILNQLSAWCQWLSAGGWGAINFDSSFSSSISGYPLGAIIAATSASGAQGDMWVNNVDGNTSNPDTGGAGWTRMSPYGTFTTGDVKFTIKTVADPGWIMMDDTSIGSAASGAAHVSGTGINANLQNLFTAIYNNITDTWAPLQTSGGVGTTRGAQGAAATAFAAGCRLFLPKSLGRALGAAGAGALLTSRALGQNLGEENHTLLLGEAPSGQLTLNFNDPQHAHQWGATNNVTGSLTPGGTVTGEPGAFTTSGGHTTVTTTTVSTGISASLTDHAGGGSHNNMQPSLFLNCMIKI